MVVRNLLGKQPPARPGLQTHLFAEITSAHGCGFFIASSGWLARSAWFILTLTGFILSIFFTLKIGLSAFQPPFYSTDLSVVSGDVTAVSSPDLVVCDPSPWDFDKAEHLNISLQQLSYIAFLLYPQNTLGNEIFIENNLGDADKDYQRLLQRFDSNPVNLLNNVTKSCHQLIVYCQLGPTRASSNEECCRRLFSNVEYILMYKCYSSGGMLDYKMLEPSQAYGITVTAYLPREQRHLNISVAGLVAKYMSGISAAVADKKSNLYHVGQTNLKLLEPNTYNVLPVEKREIDSFDKSSYFQNYKGKNDMVLNFSSLGVFSLILLLN
jgi:hypothetical protein